jgi:hypothetical protein
LSEKFDYAGCLKFDFAVEAGYDGACVSEDSDVVTWGESLEQRNDIEGDFDRPSGAPRFCLLSILSIKKGDEPFANGSSRMNRRKDKQGDASSSNGPRGEGMQARAVEEDPDFGGWDGGVPNGRAVRDGNFGVGGKVFAGEKMKGRLPAGAPALTPEGSGGFGEVGRSGFGEDDIG